jgi:hypothetical protein
MKGKVAVILTGHMRSWKQVFPNFKEKIIDKYNPDIFRYQTTGSTKVFLKRGNLNLILKYVFF